MRPQNVPPHVWTGQFYVEMELCVCGGGGVWEKVPQFKMGGQSKYL